MTATTTNFAAPLAIGNGLIKSCPHCMKGHGEVIEVSSFGGKRGMVACSWHPGHFFMKFLVPGGSGASSGWPKWFPQICSLILANTYWASSGEIHLRRGLEKPLLYKTPPNNVNRAGLSLTLCSSSRSPSSLPSDRNFMMSIAHSGDAEVVANCLANSTFLTMVC